MANETTWRLKFDAKGAKGAKTLARDLRDLDAALKSLGDSSGVLTRIANDAAALRGAKVRIQAERRVGDESVRQQARVDRERRQSIADRRREDAGINRASDKAARDDARLARELATLTQGERTQRRRDNDGIARAAARADREDARAALGRRRVAVAEATERRRIGEGIARASAREDAREARGIQQIARLNSNAFRRDMRDTERSERREQRRIEGIARLNSQAFKRDGIEQTRQIQRSEARQTRAAATARRDWGRIQGEQASGLSTVASSFGLVLGLAGALSFATIGAFSVITDMVGAVGRLVFGLSSAVLEMIAFRESSLTTLRALARDDAGNHLRGAAADAQARQRFGFAQRFARETPLDSAQVIGLQRQTSAAGFTGARNEEVVRAAADVGAFNPSDADASRRFLLGLGQLRNASTVRTQDVRQTAEAAGLGENDILRAIARGAGATQRQGEADSAYNGRIQGMQRAGRFTGAQGVEGVLTALRERNGGDLGSFARQQGNTIAGTISNLRGAVLDFVTSIDDIENLPGIKALKKLLGGIVETLTGTGPTAKRLRQDFEGIVNTVAQLAAGLGGEGKDGVAGMLGEGLTFLERWAPVVRDVMGAFGGAAWESFKAGIQPVLDIFGGDGVSGTEQWITLARQLGNTLGWLLGIGVQITAAIGLMTVGALVGMGLIKDWVRDAETWARALPARIGDYFFNVFPTIGANIVLGIATGFRSQAGAFLGEVSDWGGGIADSVRGVLGIESPSKVFAEIGRFSAMGMSQGLDSGARDVQRAMSDVITPPTLPGFGGVAGGLAGMGGSFSAVFNITVQGGGSSAETGREIGEAAWSHLVDRLEMGAAMQGA